MASGSKLSAHDVRLRKDAGKYLRGLRDKAELTQNELARLVGVNYYTFISQIEIGNNRLPYENFAKVSKVLQVNRQEMSRTLLRMYEPVLYDNLFEVDPLPPRTRPTR